MKHVAPVMLRQRSGSSINDGPVAGQRWSPKQERLQGMRATFLAQQG